MQYKQKKGLRISALSLGTVQLGMPYGIANSRGKPAAEESHLILTEALKGGVTCLDTAHAYGNSEYVLGQFFRDKEKPLIVTKMRLDLSPNANRKQVEQTMYRLVEESLTRLGLQQIPMMMIHNSDVLADHAEVISETFHQLIQERLVRMAGVSMGANVHEQHMNNVCKAVEDDLYEAVQIPINILDRRLEQSGLLQQLKNSGKIIFARSIFLQGALFLEFNRLPSYLQSLKPFLESLRHVAEHEGMSLAQMAISYVRDMETIDSLVIGAETPEQLRQNIEWIEGPSISEHAQCKLDELFIDLPESVLDPSQWEIR